MPVGDGPPPGLGAEAATASANWAPTFGPEADLLAFVSDRSGEPRLWAGRVGDGGATPLDTGPDPVSEVSWSPDGTWLACLVAPGGAARTEVWVIRPDGRDLHQIAGFGGTTAFFGAWSHDGTWLTVAEADAVGRSAAYLIDPLTGRRVWVGEAELRAAVDLSRDGTTALLRCGPRSARWLEVVHVIPGATSPTAVTGGLGYTDGWLAGIGTPPGAGSETGPGPGFGPAGTGTGTGSGGSPRRLHPADGEGSTDQGRFSTDGTLVYVRTDVGRELPALIAVPVGTDGSPRVLAERADAELEHFVVSTDGTTAALFWNVFGGSSDVSVLDLRTGAERALPSLPGEVISGGELSHDGRALVLTVEGPAQPRTIWVVDLDTDRADPVTYPPPVTVPSGPVGPELRRFTAHDGLELTGWLYLADGAGDGPPGPAVIHFHGGPEAQTRPGYHPLYRELVSRGITVFAPNVRGSSGFGRSFVNADNREKRYDGIEDVRSTARYLVDAGLVDPARLGVAGRSYGGYLTLVALTWFPELFAAGVDTCGMVDLETFYERTEPWIAAAAVSKYGHPVHDRDLLRDLSPIHRIDRLTAPLLVVHGAHDTNVPLHEAEQVVTTLRALGRQVRFLRFDDEGHELLRKPNRAAYVRAVGDFLTTHL